MLSINNSQSIFPSDLKISLNSAHERRLPIKRCKTFNCRIVNHLCLWLGGAALIAAACWCFPAERPAGILDAAIAEILNRYHDPQRVQNAEFDAVLRRRCFEIADQHRDSINDVVLMLFVANHWPASEDGKNASQRLLNQVTKPGIAIWVSALGCIQPIPPNLDLWQPLVRRLIDRLTADDPYPEGGKLLVQMSDLVVPCAQIREISFELLEIGELIGGPYARSRDVVRFCELVGGGVFNDAPAWGYHFETILRQLLEVNQDRDVCRAAKFALANVVRSHGAERQPEALRLFEEFVEQYDGKTADDAKGAEELYRVRSQQLIESMLKDRSSSDESLVEFPASSNGAAATLRSSFQ